MPLFLGEWVTFYQKCILNYISQDAIDPTEAQEDF